ncbi:hypothetical protein CHH83_02655 [Bacillus sp. 7586-K]|nr:hypothetical protein CHH83_02655 [Bacillus sp. 7586-K]
MSNYYSDYKNYFKLNTNNTSVDKLISDSKEIINNNFTNSLFNETIYINGIETIAIVKQEKNSEEKTVILRPDNKIEIGSLVKVNNYTYLAINSLSDGIYSIYPTTKVKLCNSTYLLPGTITKVQIGVNDFGLPIYEYKESDPTPLPCVVETTITSDDTDEAINLPEGTILVTIPYTEHESLRENTKFKMYGNSYEIIGIDYSKSVNKVGLLSIKGKKV